MPDVPKLFRIRIKELRIASGFTQEQYAEKCGIPYKVLQHLERGRRSNPRLSTLEKLAKGAGVEVYDLFSPILPKLSSVKQGPRSYSSKKKE